MLSGGRRSIDLHNHPNGVAMFSEQDFRFYSARKIRSDAYVITPNGKGVRLKITDWEKWDGASNDGDFGRSIKRTRRLIRKHAQKDFDEVYSSIRRANGASGIAQTEANLRWKKVYAKEGRRLYNEIGKDYGFKIEEWNPFD